MGCFPYLKSKLKGRGQSPSIDLNGKRSSGTFMVQDQTIKSSNSMDPSPRGIPDLYQEKAHNLRVFSFSELRQATRDFSMRLKIGEGGFGSVYKGYIRPVDGDGEHVAVAIKKLNKDSLQGHRQWVAEVQFLGVVEHPNLVKLIGYCAVDGDNGNIQRLLVYQFMPKRSLEDHLFRRVYPPLLWETRLHIMLGAAQGLSYLHEGLEVQVIFRDFKCSNVLLDENLEPRLSDFGLAREGPVAGNTHVSTAVVGTHGYAAPDYIKTGRLTAKSDVWSFGVVLYEILTGRRSFERGLPKPEQVLLEWVQQFPPDSKRFVSMIDPRLGNQFSVKAAREMAKLAESCLVHNAKERPKMSEVVERLLRQIMEAPDEESSESDEEGESNDNNNSSSSKDDEASESWKRRMAQLEKLGQYGDGEDRRKLRVLRAG